MALRSLTSNRFSSAAKNTEGLGVGDAGDRDVHPRSRCGWSIRKPTASTRAFHSCRGSRLDAAHTRKVAASMPLRSFYNKYLEGDITRRWISQPLAESNVLARD